MLKNFEHKINENKKNYTFFKLWEKAFIEYKIMNSFILNIHKAIKYDIKDFQEFYSINPFMSKCSPSI